MNYLLSLLAPILITVLQNPESQLFNEGPIFIEGHIDNTEGDVVLLTTLELTGRVEHTAKLDSMGNFSFKSDVLSSHDNYIYYGGDIVTIYLNPGDSLKLTANGANFENSLEYSGDNDKFNHCLQKFFVEFKKALISDRFFEKKNDLEPNQFKEYAFNFFKKMDAIGDSICIAVQPPEEVKTWITTYNKYRLAEDLLEYGMHKNNHLSTNYYDFEQLFLDNSEYVMHCSQYYEDFIEKYYLGYIMPKIEGFDKVISGLQEQTYEGLNLVINFLDENTSNSTVKNLLITRFMNDFIDFDYKIADTLYNKFSKVVNDLTCQNFILQRIDNVRSLPPIVKTIDDLVNLKLVGGIFKEISEECRNKVLYIDIWGTWCGGCINAFPYSNKLHEELSNENIEFIYLCVHSDESNWKKVINEYSIRGKHYLLSNDQFAVISEKFNCYGVPRYIIVNKDGVIVDEVAKLPYSEALKDELLILLSE